MKIQCDSKDYDFYTFAFPLKAFYGGRRNKYIFGQLEKMHPCFSDNCCYDYKLRLEKKKLKADVVVMQKYRLAEYKNRHQKIRVAEKPGTVFFKSEKHSGLFMGLVLLLLLAVFLFFVLPKKEKQKVGQAAPETETFEDREDLYELPCQKAALLLENAEKLGGLSDYFTWESDGFTEKLSLSLKKVYPEEIQAFLPEAVFSSVKFNSTPDGSIPAMTVQLNQRVRNGFEQKQNQYDKVYFRNFLQSEKEEALIMEECVKPDAIKFSLKGDLKNKTERLLAVIDEKEISVSSLVIKKQADEIFFEIVFSDMKLTNQSLLIKRLMQGVNLFFEEMLEEEREESPVQDQEQKAAADALPREQMTLLGKIIHEDGSVIEYYKNRLGKIIKKER